MKTYFKILLLAIVVMWPKAMNAQYYMVYKANGDMIIYNHSEIDSIIFCQDSYLLNGREAIDLGLSIKWATCNVGADTPEDYGGIYMWGDTNPETREYNTWSTYLDDYGNPIQEDSDCGTSKDPLRNYVYPYDKSISGTKFDIVTSLWGGNWQMPTLEQWEELSGKCSWIWGTRNEVNGWTIIGPNGNSIFLPAAGYHLTSDGIGYMYGVGEYGTYWTANADIGSPYVPTRAKMIHIRKGEAPSFNYIAYRCSAHHVRPVIK